MAFVIAGNVKTADDQALLQRWLDDGHEIGSHSHTHPSFTALTSEAYLADLAAARTSLSAWLTPRGRTLVVPLPYLKEATSAEGRGARPRSLPPAAQVPVTIEGATGVDRPWADAVAAATPRDGDVRQSN